jgi:excisionase family DNA binding protein
MSTDDQLYYTTSQAAAELGTSQQRILDLCKADAIQAELTPGGHFRIPRSFVDRLKATGLPPLARPLPGGDGPRYRHRHHLDDRDPHRLAGQAPTVVDAFSSVRRKEAELASRRLDLELLEAEQEIAQRRRKREREEREEEARAGGRRRREEWSETWLKRTLENVPAAVGKEYMADVYLAVKDKLAALRGDEPDSIVETVLDATVEKVLAPLLERTRALAMALQKLPEEMKQSPMERFGASLAALYGYRPWLGEWETKARHAGSVALTQAMREANGQPVPFERLLVVATAAVEGVIDEFRASAREAGGPA